MERIPITKANQLDMLDETEMVEGYLDGYGGEPAAGDNRSYSYWHGWRNGKADKTHVSDDAQKQLARDCIETGYFNQPQTKSEE